MDSWVGKGRIADQLETAMFKVTRFCVQPYVRRGEVIVAGEPERHPDRVEAIKAAARMQRRVAGAAVYEVTGWPVQDLWGKPRLLAAYGELPRDVTGAA